MVIEQRDRHKEALMMNSEKRPLKHHDDDDDDDDDIQTAIYGQNAGILHLLVSRTYI